MRMSRTLVLKVLICCHGKSLEFAPVSRDFWRSAEQTVDGTGEVHTDAVAQAFVEMHEHFPQEDSCTVERIVTSHATDKPAEFARNEFVK
jgi:hypothetical protein